MGTLFTVLYLFIQYLFVIGHPSHKYEYTDENREMINNIIRWPTTVGNTWTIEPKTEPNRKMKGSQWLTAKRICIFLLDSVFSPDSSWHWFGHSYVASTEISINSNFPLILQFSNWFKFPLSTNIMFQLRQTTKKRPTNCKCRYSVTIEIRQVSQRGYCQLSACCNDMEENIDGIIYNVKIELKNLLYSTI